MAKRNPKTTPLPAWEDILEFIKSSPSPVGKREIARAFHLKSQHRIWLKDTLKKMADKGLIDKKRKKQIHSKSALPRILVCEVSHPLPEEDAFLLVSAKSHEDNRKIILKEKPGLVLAPTDRVLVQLKLMPEGYYKATLIKKFEASTEAFSHVGVIIRQNKSLYFQHSSRKSSLKGPFPLAQTENPPQEGDVVIADVKRIARFGQRLAKIKRTLGHISDPHIISLMAIFNNQIPFVFPEAVLKEAEIVKDSPFTPSNDRIDLRHIPFVTIDGEDARDFDDAVWSGYDDVNGWQLKVAIADVAYYVRPGSQLDQEAYKRGNSVYFPDRVIPMLPEILSNGVCSLNPQVDRACLVASMIIDEKGRLKSYVFQRAIIRSVARLTYNQVQKAYDGELDATTEPLMSDVIKPLYQAYAILKKAREFRGTLDLELTEQQVVFDEKGHIKNIFPRQRLDSHKLIEEFMILANVAAAQQLDQKQFACIYRIHEPPSAEKLLTFRDILKGLGISFPQSKAIQPKMFSDLLQKIEGTPYQSLVNQLTLRTQSQAIYNPNNIGHFGLSLQRYSHFTSPIRRYADIIVHRCLIAALKLGDDGLPKELDLGEISSHVSVTERRADAAEREALERYVTIYLREYIGENFEGRISGVTHFGLFVMLLKTGTDGLIPLPLMPPDHYFYEEAKHRLVGNRSRRSYTLGDAVAVKLINVDSITNSVTLELVQQDKIRTQKTKRLSNYKNRSKKHPQ